MAPGNFEFGRVREPLRVVLAGAVFFAVTWMTPTVRGNQSTPHAGSENAASRTNVEYSPPVRRRLMALLVLDRGRLTSTAHAVTARTGP
jgi:hypothetical protein